MLKYAHSMFRLMLPVVLLAAIPARACETPVFLYALDNWAAEPYDVVVFHRGALSPNEARIVSMLRDNALRANMRVVNVDLDRQTDSAVERLWTSQQGATLPWITAYFPRSGGFTQDPSGVRFLGHRPPIPAWSGALTESNARAMLDSPVRRTIARHLMNRVSGVWILLEIGNSRRDNEAYRTLQTQLARLERTLYLPDLIDAGTGMDIDISIKFPILRVSRDDPAEQALVQTLLNSEKGLHDLQEPMAFPIFGRGIILYALVGRGINEVMIEDAAEFLTGPCSCEVKALNPGIDMLMAVDWDGQVERLDLEEIPPPTGLTEFAARAEQAEELLKVPEAPEQKPKEETPDEPEQTDASEESEEPDESDESDLSDEPEPSHQPEESDSSDLTAATSGLERNLILVMLVAVGGIVALTLVLLVCRRRRAGE